MRWISLLFLVCLSSCYTPDRYFRNFGNFSDYGIHKSKGTYTKDGIIVVLEEGQYLSFNKIDKLTSELEECLGMPIKREWIGIYVPNNWFISECSGEEKLPVAGPPEACREKGLIVEPECEWIDFPSEVCPCPCGWRAIVQDNFWIITTPNLNLYKAEVARLVTNVSNIWHDDRYKHCL